MKKNPFCLTLVFLFVLNMLSAQNQKCGVTAQMGQMIREQIIQNRNEMRDFVQVRNATVYLPIRFFMVAKSDGSDRTSEFVALKALCQLNTNYADQDIQFYLKEFKYLNNTTLHQNPSDAFSFLKSTMLGNYNAINVFIVDQIGSAAPGVVLAYYQPPASGTNRNDWLVAAETYTDDFEVLTHEIGHFFSLQHTFFGWEETSWSNGVAAPVNAGGIKVEMADGSNCAVAADMICDTPADYLHIYDPGCSYKDNALDPLGMPINPDPKNFMTYNNSSCIPDLYFTDGQKEEIQNSLNSNSRTYIPKNYTPSNLNQITATPTILTPPQNLQTIPTYNNVKLEWTDIANADSYLVEVAALSGAGAGAGKKNYLVNDNQITLTDLFPQSNYSFKVIGFNEYATCGGTSSPRIFKTGNDVVSDTNELPGLSNWSISPNPVKSGESFLLNIESEKELTLDVAVTTITGRKIRFYSGQKFANGTTAFEMNTENFPAGIYLVSIQTATGIQTKRVSIL